MKDFCIFEDVNAVHQDMVHKIYELLEFGVRIHVWRVMSIHSKLLDISNSTVELVENIEFI